MSYQRPETLQQALDLRASGDYLVLAGGTDFYPARVARPIAEPVLDISALTDLRGISRVDTGSGQGWRIGALTTWTDLVRQARAPELRALVSAAREVGGIQVQNQGTVGGNLCNASPAADGVPALAALGASVELRSHRGIRNMPVVDFVQGNRRTALSRDEILTAIDLPVFSERAASQFRKVGHRRYLVISIAMVAVCVDFDEQNLLSRCGIAVGSCAPSVRRLAVLEGWLLRTPRSRILESLQELVGRPEALQGLSPIDDLRGSASYRLDAARELIQRLFVELIDGVE